MRVLFVSITETASFPTVAELYKPFRLTLGVRAQSTSANGRGTDGGRKLVSQRHGHGGLQEALFDENPGPSGGAYTNIRRASPLTDRWQISDYIF